MVDGKCGFLYLDKNDMSMVEYLSKTIESAENTVKSSISGG